MDVKLDFDVRHLVLGGVVILFCIVFIIDDMRQRFFAIIVLVCLGYILVQRFQSKHKKHKTKDKLLGDIEKELGDDREINNSGSFFVHKNPRNIKFLRQHKELTDVLYDIKFVQIYDRALYNKVISLLEYFLRIHYKVMIGKYDFALYFPVLKDIRSELLNTLKAITFNIPNMSSIVAIPDLDAFVDKKVRHIQAITYKLIKIVCHKYKKHYKPPYDLDPHVECHYALF